MKKTLSFLIIMMLVLSPVAFAHCGHCGMGGDHSKADEANGKALEDGRECPLDKDGKMCEHCMKNKWSGLDAKIAKKAKMLVGHAEIIGLTDEQTAAINAIAEEAKNYTAEKDEAIHAAKEEYKTALYADPIDKNAVYTAIDNKYALKAEKAKGLVDRYLELKAVPTAEQWAQMKEMWTGMKEAHGKKEAA